MPPLSTADHYPSHLEESDHGATSRHITVWADSDEECDALLDLFFDAIRKGGSGLEVLNGCNQKTLDTTAVSIVPECDALLNVDVDGTNGTSASKTGLCGGPASGSSRSTEQSCQSDDSNGNVCGFCESDSICEYGPPMKATLCVQCGISGHGASTCPLGHPEDIELGDMEESDSDDHLDEVYPLLSLYIASQEALDLMPKRLVIKAGSRADVGAKFHRYFFDEQSRGGCWVCGAVDHGSSECSWKRCFFCSESGHESRTCTRRQDWCRSCNTRGHLPMECPKLALLEKVSMAGTRCLRCDRLGHVNCGWSPLLCSSSNRKSLHVPTRLSKTASKHAAVPVPPPPKAPLTSTSMLVDATLKPDPSQFHAMSQTPTPPPPFWVSAQRPVVLKRRASLRKPKCETSSSKVPKSMPAVVVGTRVKFPPAMMRARSLVAREPLPPPLWPAKASLSGFSKASIVTPSKTKKHAFPLVGCTSVKVGNILAPSFRSFSKKPSVTKAAIKIPKAVVNIVKVKPATTKGSAQNPQNLSTVSHLSKRCANFSVVASSKRLQPSSGSLPRLPMTAQKGFQPEPGIVIMLD